MEHAFLLAITNTLLEIRWQLFMFVADILILGFVSEFIKATLFPKMKLNDEGNYVICKGCPRWIGLIFGLVITFIHMSCAYAAYKAFGDEGFLIPGGAIFLWAWGIAFFLLQAKSLKMLKWLRDKLFPGLKDPTYVKPPRQPKAKTVKPAKKSYTQEELDAILASVRQNQ